MKPSRISRIVKMLTSLQSGQHNSIDDLVKMLRVSRRTIFRDLKELQNAGVPCHYDKRTNTYIINSHFFLPAPNLTTHEALGLFLLVYKATKHINIPFKIPVLRAALKIENNLPQKTKQYCNIALRNISIKTEPRAKMDSLNDKFEQLLKATLEKRVVNIRYYFPHEQKNMVIKLNPYHLVLDNHTWYIIGKNSSNQMFHTYKLSLIKELNILDKCFTDDSEFDLNEYLNRAWSIMPETRLYHIKLKFIPEVADGIAAIQWHSTQEVAHNKDGSITVEFRVHGLNEITWWILSYGDQVEVISPKVLRERIVQIAHNLLKINE